MKKASAIFLILIMLLVTVGVNINKHYCGGKLAEVSFYIGADCACGDSEMPSDCCRQESEFVQLDEEFNSSEFSVTFDTDLIAGLLTTYCELLHNAPVAHTDYLNYKPPLIQRDIPVLVQSFLI